MPLVSSANVASSNGAVRYQRASSSAFKTPVPRPAARTIKESPICGKDGPAVGALQALGWREGDGVRHCEGKAGMTR